MESCLRNGHKYKILLTQSKDILDDKQKNWIGVQVKTIFYCTKCLNQEALTNFDPKDVRVS